MANYWYPNIGSGSPGIGDVDGPASSTDKAIARFDGVTGKLLQDSDVILDASIFTFDATSGTLSASSYQMGVYDSSNVMFFNVPSTKSYFWAINGTTEMSLTSNTLRIFDNDFIGTGRFALGGDAVIGTNRRINLAYTITDFSNSSTYGAKGEMTFDPASDIIDPGALIAGHEFATIIPSTNSSNIDIPDFSNTNYFFRHMGSGDISLGTAIRGSAANEGSGDITFELVGGYFTSYNYGPGNIPGILPKAGNFALAAGSGAVGGTIARDYTCYFESPFSFGTMTQHYGLYFEDQEFGTESWAIKTNGGKIEFGAVSTKNSLLYMSSDDVILPFTGFLPVNAYGRITSYNSVQGGLKVEGYSVTDNPAMTLGGFVGDDGSIVGPVTIFNVAQGDGGGGLTSITGDCVLYSFRNNGNSIFNVITDSTSASFHFANINFSNPITDLFPTTTYGLIKTYDGTYGGLRIWGASSDESVYGLQLRGIIAAPFGFFTTATPVVITFGKQNGTGVQAVGNYERGLLIQNHTTPVVHVRGDGTIQTLGDIIILKQLLQAKGANLTAANDLVLGNDGNTYFVNGNTQINAIKTPDILPGIVIYLIFTGTPTIKHNTPGGPSTAPILLDGSVDLVAANNTVLGLVFDGTNFQQISLKAA